MAYDVKQGSFNITTGIVTTTQTITGVGFQPKALIFWWSGNTSATDAITAEDGGRGMGFATSLTSRRTACNIQGDGYTATEENIQVNDAACINNIGINGADQGAADILTLNADGFTLIIDVQFTSANRIHYLALGGSDLTNAECFTFQISSGTGNQSISSLSFQPDCVLFLSTADSTAPPTQDNGSSFGFGAAISSTERALISCAAKNNVTTSDTYAYCLDIECAATHARNAIGSGLSSRLDFVSMDTNGFTVNKLASGTEYMMGLALKGGDYAIKSSATRTDTNDIAVSGLGFQPASGLVVSACAAEHAQDTGAAHDIWSVGGFTSDSERGAMAVRNEDNVTTSNVSTAVEHDAVYCRIDPTSDTVVGLMDVKSVDSDGVTYVMDDADPDAAFFWTLFMGAEAAAAGPGAIMTTQKGFW